MIPFTKMQGLGNDYIYIDAFNNHEILNHPDLPMLAKKWSNRHFAIGADGLIIIAPPDPPAKPADNSKNLPHLRMIMYNADGSRGEMCGNGIRCVCKYAIDHNLIPNKPETIIIQTDAGNMILTYQLDKHGKVKTVTVDMGEPIFNPQQIGLNPDLLDTPQLKNATHISMGNPHTIIFLNENENLNDIPLKTIGPQIENHPAFKNRTNVHFVKIISRTELIMRTWERGSGITLACGTGASAVCAAAVITNRTDRKVTIHLPGGDLQLHWNEKNNHLYMTGPATESYQGTADPTDLNQ